MTDDFTPLARRPDESPEDWGGRLVGDLARRRRRGAGSPVEAYLQRFPELAAEPEALGDLLVAEWTLRREAGERFTRTEYLRRFPGREGEMNMLWEADQHIHSEAKAPDAPDEGRPPAWYTGPAALPVEFAGYRLIREFGGGGMARVFLAEPGPGGEAVVLKVPKLPDGQGEGGVRRRASAYQRFLREARHTRDLDHPHLCRALDVGERDDLPYFTMPYYPGGSLADELGRRGRFPALEAARLVIDVAHGLQHAHDRGLIHRDIKPSNLLRDGTRVVVTDFGLALPLADEELRLTTTGQIVGTALYLSPEQARRQELTPASDVFCLGVLLYEIVSGQAPFRGPNAMDLLIAIEAAAPQPLEQRCPDVPPALAAICRRAMARSPGDRYGSMKDFADDLARFLGGTWAPPAQAPDGLTETDPIVVPFQRAGPQPWSAWAKQPRVLLAGVAAGLGVFLGVSAYRGFSGDKAPVRDIGGARVVASTRQPIGYRRQLQMMHDDLDKLDAVVRPHVRYFSLTAVHDNPYVGDAEWNAHLPALRRVLNRLSHDKADVPVYADASGCLLRIDLRDLGWHPEVEWKMLLRAEPYGVRYDAVNPDESLRRLARETYALAGVNSLFEVPVVRGDWFVAAASQSPLLDELLQIDGKGRLTPVFGTTGPDDPLAVVVREYRKDIDEAAGAAELGLGTAGQLDAAWPAGRAELRQALDRPVSRGDWAGEEGSAKYAKCVRALKLGVPRATQAVR